MSDHVGDDPTPHAGSGAPRRSATQLASDPAFTGTYARRPAPASIWVMGDSITANGYTAPTATDGPQWGGQSVVQWAVQLSGARYRVGGIAATGGYSTAQVLSTHVPTVVAARPAFCVVLCGTNDVPLGGAAAKANLQAIWSALANAGITPILATLTPRNDYSGSGVNTITAFNAWITRQARLNGWPLVDYFAATADPATGQYLTGYNQDSVHPNTVGAKAMGQALANLLLAQTGPSAPTPPPMPLASNWTSLAVPTNALNLASTTGLPTGWATDFGSGATTTATAMSASEGVGNWFNIARGGTNVSYRPSAGITLVPGNRMAIAFKYKTANVVSTSATFRLRLTDTNGAHVLWGFDNISGVDVTLGTVYEEFDVPSALVTNTAKYGFTLNTGDATLSLGQFALIDLTAAGIYP